MKSKEKSWSELIFQFGEKKQNETIVKIRSTESISQIKIEFKIN